MSLLEGNTTVLVQCRTRGADADGNPATVDDGDPVEVRCRVAVPTSEESSARGLDLLSTRKVLARSWPGDERGRVWHEGRWWDTAGEPERYADSPRTAHTTVYIRTTKPTGEA